MNRATSDALFGCIGHGLAAAIMLGLCLIALNLWEKHHPPMTVTECHARNGVVIENSDRTISCIRP